MVAKEQVTKGFWTDAETIFWYFFHCKDISVWN